MTTSAVGPAASPVLLPGFDYRRIDVEGVTISCAVTGAGPPLLQHGSPQNHLWRHVASPSARTTLSFCPTCPDTPPPANPPHDPPDPSTPSRPPPPHRYDSH